MFLPISPNVVKVNIDPLDVELLKSSITNISKQVEWDQNQISLQHRDGIETLNDGIGSITYREGEPQSDTEFHLFYSQFDSEPVVKILKNLPFDVYRTRIMKILPKRCYTMHIDKAIRFHIPVDTAEGQGRFIFDHGEVHKLNEGELYIINTKKLHTAINCHKTLSRVHIVGCLDDEDNVNGLLSDIYQFFNSRKD